MKTDEAGDGSHPYMSVEGRLGTDMGILPGKRVLGRVGMEMLGTVCGIAWEWKVVPGAGVGWSSEEADAGDESWRSRLGISENVGRDDMMVQ